MFRNSHVTKGRQRMDTGRDSGVKKGVYSPIPPQMATGRVFWAHKSTGHIDHDEQKDQIRPRMGAS